LTWVDFGQHPLESLAELRIEDAIYNGIQSAVEVAQPSHCTERYGRYACTEGAYHINSKKGCPAKEKCTHDHP